MVVAKKIDCKLLPVFLGFWGAFKNAIWTYDPSLEKRLARAMHVAIVDARPQEDEKTTVTRRAQIGCPLAQLLAKKIDCKLLPLFLGFLGAFKDLDAEELGKIVAKAALNGTDEDLAAYFTAQKQELVHLFKKTNDIEPGEEQDESFYDLLVVAKSCATMGIPILRAPPVKIATHLLALIEFGVVHAFSDAPDNLAFLDPIEYYTKWFRSRAQKAKLAEIVHAKVEEFRMEQQYAAVEEGSDIGFAWLAYASFLYGEEETGTAGVFTGTKHDLGAAKAASPPTSAASPAASPVSAKSALPTRQHEKKRKKKKKKKGRKKKKTGRK